MGKLQNDLRPYKKVIAGFIVLLVANLFNYTFEYLGFAFQVPDEVIGLATLAVVYVAENIDPPEVAVGKLLKSVNTYGIKDREAIAQMLEQVK